MADKQIHIRVSESFFNGLRHLAIQENLTINDLVFAALDVAYGSKIHELEKRLEAKK